jgi:hypothetical protein
MSPALPGTCGLFSTLQDTLSEGDQRHVRLNRHVHDTSAEFTLLVDSLASRHTHLFELVPQAPIAISACDACQRGMGGVWLFPVGRAPVVWCAPFARTVSSSLITATHKTGRVSISDLELAGSIAHKDAATGCVDTREQTLWIASDNKAAISWSNKGLSTSISACAPTYCNTTHCISNTTDTLCNITTSRDPSTLWRTMPVGVGTFPTVTC